jgi:tRNA C32,U32 (ribose-2'-O)-methylase TrmJ
LRNADYLIEPLQAGNIGIAARAWNIYHLLKNLLSSLEQLYGTSRKNAGSDIDIVEFTRKNISSLADK